MGQHLSPDNIKYQYLLFDFLEQASRFQGDRTMNDEERAFLEFWKKNYDKVDNIQAMCDRFKQNSKS